MWQASIAGSGGGKYSRVFRFKFTPTRSKKLDIGCDRASDQRSLSPTPKSRSTAESCHVFERWQAQSGAVGRSVCTGPGTANRKAECLSWTGRRSVKKIFSSTRPTDVHLEGHLYRFEPAAVSD